LHPRARESHHARAARGAGIRQRPPRAPGAPPPRAGAGNRARRRVRLRPPPPSRSPGAARRRANRAGDHVRGLPPRGPRARLPPDAGARGAPQGGALVPERGRPRQERVVIGLERDLEAAQLDLVVERAQSWFFREQFDDGYFWAELESNATM